MRESEFIDKYLRVVDEEGDFVANAKQPAVSWGMITVVAFMNKGHPTAGDFLIRMKMFL